MTGQTSAMPDGRGWPRMRARCDTTGRCASATPGPVGDLSRARTSPIRAKILLSLCIVILMMGITNVLMMFQWLNYSRQYDAIITNITTANSISGNIKPDIDTEMWKIVSGQDQFPGRPTVPDHQRMSTPNCNG